MAHEIYAPLVTQFRAEAPTAGPLRKLFSRLLGGGRRFAGKAPSSEAKGFKSLQPDGLAMLEQEVNRIRLQSRHWLM